MHTIILIITSLSIFAHQVHKADYFEGKIVYEIHETKKEDKISSSQILSKQIIHLKDSFYKHQYIGYTDFGETIVNTKDTTRYSVDFSKKIALSLGAEENSEAYLPNEIKFLHKNDTILGHPCKKYELIQLDFFSQQEMKSYLWVTEDLHIMNLPLLAKIFGYRNTLIKDGSLGGIALKYESTDLIIKATEIKPMDLDPSAFAIPIMYHRQ